MAPSTDDRIPDSPGKPPSGVVVAFVDAVNRQDWRAVEALVATTFIRHSDAGGRIEGRDGLIAFLQGSM